MGFLKKLFGGGSDSAPRDKNGLYFYVRPKGCQEVVKVRIDVSYDLSPDDEEVGYFVRKSVRGTTYKCTRSAELYVTFDSNRSLQEAEITDGALVDEAAYTDWVAQQGAS